MNKGPLLRLKLAATDFRDAIQRADKHKLGVVYEDFPHGSCGDACMLLARHLRDAGFGEFEYICGWLSDPEDNQPCSHAWLRQGKTIVDITADQFPDREPVVVTDDSSWYECFEDQSKGSSDFEKFRDRQAFLDAYHEILSHLTNSLDPEPSP